MRTLHAVILLLGVLGACSREKETGETKGGKRDAPKASTSASRGEHADEPAHELPRRVKLDPSVVNDAKISTAPATKELLVATIDLPGEVTSDPDKSAKVSALLPGRIDSVSVKEGQAVKKGDVLAVIKVPDLGKAKAAYTATAAKAVSARSNADRLQALADKRLAGTQELMAAKADADALEAEARAAAAQLSALGTGASGGAGDSQLVVRAPIAGVVMSRDAVVGQPVTADQTLATIADLTEVWFLGRVFENNLSQLQIGARAEIRLNAYPKEAFDGSVEYLGKQIDPTSRTVVARVRIVNRKDVLRIGLFGVARVAVAEDSAQKKAPAIVVPRSAVTEIGDKLSVFVRQPDGDFDLHEVVLGDGALGKVQVLSGLREGEQVVVSGVFTLKSALLKSTFSEEE